MRLLTTQKIDVNDALVLYVRVVVWVIHGKYAAPPTPVPLSKIINDF